jgi:formate hydrogenlyase subunit 4
MSVLIALLQALVLFAVAPLLSGTRVARARLHNRRGPGVLQEYRDILKLLGRQSVGPDASGWVFRLTPYVMVGVMLTIATALPVVTVDSPLPGLGDLITLIYLFAIARFFFAISGLDTGSPFTARGQPRSDARRAGGADPAAGPVGRGAGRRLHPYQQHHRHHLSLAGARTFR